MPEAKNKTVATKNDVNDFIAAQPAAVQEDLRVIMGLMQKTTKERPKMWGPSIVGYGTYHFKYESGREGDFLITGFSPRKAAISLYLNADLEQEGERLKKLGKHKLSGGCLHIKRMADVDVKTLEQLILKGVKAMEKQRVR